MSRWALRIRRGPFAGDIIGLHPHASREAAETLRGELTMREHLDVVEIDEAGDVMHRTVASDGGSRFACIDCGATSRNREPDGPCAGVTT